MESSLRNGTFDPAMEARPTMDLARGDCLAYKRVSRSCGYCCLCSLHTCFNLNSLLGAQMHHSTSMPQRHLLGKAAFGSPSLLVSGDLNA